jgi:hypothetical protein
LRLRALIPLALAGAALVPASAQAETRYLDSYDKGRDRYAGPLRFAQPLERRRPYVVAAQGTVSFFSNSAYANNCGSKPEPRPMFPSRRRPRGPVGFDPEFFFAEPRTRGGCRRPTPPFRSLSFQMSAGGRFAHPAPLGTAPTVPTARHGYAYPFIGRGQRPRFRLFDENTRDNYGRLKITVRRARAADCANDQFKQFGYTSRAACVAATARRGVTR